MRKYVIAAAIAIPVIVLLVIGGAYVRDEVIDANRVSRGVTVVGVDVSRSTPSETASIVISHEADLLATPVIVTVDELEREIYPADVGLAVDEDAIAQEAMTTRREDGFWANLSAWAGSWRSSKAIEVPVSIDDEALTAILDGFTDEIDKPPYNGTMRVVDAEVVPEYPREGVQVDVVAAVPLIREQLLQVEHEPVEIPLAPIPTLINAQQLDAAVAEATDLVDAPVFLREAETGKTIVFTTAGLKTALRHEILVNSPASIDVSLDAETLSKIAARTADRFTIPAVPASYTFNQKAKLFTVVPSIPSVVVDLDSIPDTVEAAIKEDGRGRIPMVEGPDAEFNTQVARAGMPLQEVSTFTTYHPAGQSRVTNIQNLADEIAGSVVLPGETFSVNDTAGKRTLEEGYVRAGAIIDGEVTCCDSPINIGGGTSQFATTFYNAVFFGCYEDVFHQPHSLYFSRYPFVREATLGFPLPDVIFRNDSDTAVYIDTSYTSGSITVTFYGDNGGRTCTSSTSGNTNTRTMTHADGSVTTESWTWRYKQPKKKDE
ncbi:MAG: VanW family protein [Actinomycetota bacterium]